mgnify:FL=1
MPFAPLNPADGQLPAASGTLLGAEAFERTAAVKLFNTSSAKTEKIHLFLTRTGSSARQFARAELGPYESMYLDGIAMDSSDILTGYASDAATVDYVVSRGGGQFAITVRDKTGAPKASSLVEVTIPDKAGLTEGEVKVSGQLEEIKNVLLKIA